MKKVLSIILYTIIISFILINLTFFGILGAIAYTFCNIRLALIIFGFILFCLILFIVGIILTIKDMKN